MSRSRGRAISRSSIVRSRHRNFPRRACYDVTWKPLANPALPMTPMLQLTHFCAKSRRLSLHAAARLGRVTSWLGRRLIYWSPNTAVRWALTLWVTLALWSRRSTWRDTASSSVPDFASFRFLWPLGRRIRSPVRTLLSGGSATVSECTIP